MSRPIWVPFVRRSSSPGRLLDETTRRRGSTSCNASPSGWRLTCSEGDFSIADVDGRAWIALIWYGVGTLALGTWLWYSGVEKAEGSIAAGFMGVMPVSALVLSYVLLGERFEWTHLAGFLIVFAGVAVISWEHGRMQQKD